MSNKRGRHNRRGGRVTPKGTRPLHLVHTEPPRARPASPAEELVGRALDADGPLPLLAAASSVLWVLRPDAPGRADEVPSLAELVSLWAEAHDRSTTALLALIGQMAADAEVRDRTARILAARAAPSPEWIARLGDVRVTQVVVVSHALGDGDLYLIELDVPGAGPVTLDVYVDHNLGTVVKSAFAIPDSIEAVKVTMASLLADPDTTVTDLPPADARARIEEALAEPLTMVLATIGATDDDAWPSCWPLLEWALRLLPTGGASHPRVTWNRSQRDELMERFFASPWGRPQRDLTRRHLLDHVLDLLDDDFKTDVMRWSPEVVIRVVEQVVDDHDIEADRVRATADLLRAFVGFCHGERGIRSSLTEETMSAVDRLEVDLARHALARSEEFDWDGPAASERYFLQSLAEEVGGEDALDALDGTPLPDEPFEWSGIPDEVHAQVAAIVEIVDAQCDEHFDVELRTAARRLIARAAKGDPEAFARARKPEPAAAALVWIVASGNDAFARHDLLIRDFMAGLGLKSSSPAQRAEVFLRAARLGERGYGHLRLGDVRLLTSARRRELRDRRDRYLRLIDKIDQRSEGAGW